MFHTTYVQYFQMQTPFYYTYPWNVYLCTFMYYNMCMMYCILTHVFKYFFMFVFFRACFKMLRQFKGQLVSKAEIILELAWHFIWKTLCISSLYQYLLLKGDILCISEQSGSPSFMDNQCKMFILQTCSITRNPPSTCKHILNHVTTMHTFSIMSLGALCKSPY